MSKFIIITSINEETKSILEFRKFKDWNIIVVGDIKTPKLKSNGNLTFLSVEDQLNLNYPLIKNIPFNHYCRKNIGYIYAIKNGATLIYDTDDDNLPLFKNFTLPEFNKEISSKDKLINIYQHYSDKFIWSRGFPLNRIHDKQNIFEISSIAKNPDLIYGLCDGDTDLDAVCRIITNDENLKFSGNPAYLNDKNMIIFNSQSTFWTNRKYFPFLYLPTTVSSRFSDILRSYVMQFCCDAIIGIQPNVAFQKRNHHNLIDDMKDEIFMYENIENVIKLGENFSGSSIFNFYKKLYDSNIVGEKELDILKFWISFLKKNNKL